MSRENITKENLYIYFNSLVSISSIPETNINIYSNYLLRIENLEQTLLLKKCIIPISDFSDLKESLFYIREIDNEDNDDKEISNNTEELLENKRINYNQKFILQHMISKKYISLEILPGNNNYNLKLSSNKDSSVPFLLKRIHETRTSQEFLTFKQSFYLSIYIKEKDQFYYINFSSYSGKLPEYDTDSLLLGQNNFYASNENIISNKNNNINIGENEENNYNSNAYFYENFSELSIEKKMNCKYIFLNQSWYLKNQDKLFSSQIINIIFVNSNLYKDNSENNLMTEKEEQFMLSAEYIDNINMEEAYDYNTHPLENSESIKERKDVNYFYDENKGLISLMTNKKKLANQVRVKLVPYETDFYKHVINNSFWVLEEELTDHKERLEKIPLKKETQIKIKNVLLGLYLKVKKKGNEIEKEEEIVQTIDENNPNQNIDNTTKNSDKEEEAEYEFELVDEETLIKNNLFFSNFMIYHYSINKEKEFMSYNGKFALRNNFKDDKKDIQVFDFEEMNKYFQPLSINLDSEKKYYILPKNEDEFIFEFKKIDIYEANHVIYMSKLIDNFNFYLDKCMRNEIRINSSIKVIIFNLTFFSNYLINVEYIFRDENFDINEPIEQRQVILENYGVLKSIRKIAKYLLPIIKDMNSRNNNIYHLRKSSYNKNISDNRSIYGSLLNNYENINTNRYRIDTLNEKFNAYNVSIVNMKKLIAIILNFLTFLSNNNEEIKEKIFLDLDIILELAENVFVLDKSNLLNFIFKLIKHSEVLQEYITGGKLNLLFTIKNSSHYSRFAEKESQNKLIRIDKILSYIETSNNYLYYYKKLLKLNKVKHKREQIKQLIIDHMNKVENEYKTKYNYKRNLINIINRTKMILKKIEIPLLKNAENNDKIAEKELHKNKLRKAIFAHKKTTEDLNNKEKKKKNQEDNNYSKETGKNEKDIKTLDSMLISETNELKREEEKNENKNQTKGQKKKIINLLQNWIGPEDDEENNSFSLMNNLSQKDERINQKSKLEENLKCIKFFLSFFENFNINNTLFIQEKCYEDFFNSFKGIKLLRKNLDFIVGEKNKSIPLIDGIKLEQDSELGPLIPFNIFNKFFPKFLCTRDINYNNNLNNIIDNIDEDSENDLYNNKEIDTIIEKPDFLEDDNINNEILINNKNNFKPNKMKTTIFGYNKNLLLKSTSNEIQDNSIFNKNNNINNDNKIIRHSVTNPRFIRNTIMKNYNIDDSLLVEFDQKQIDKKLNKLNRYLSMYLIYKLSILHK